MKIVDKDFADPRRRNRKKKLKKKKNGKIKRGETLIESRARCINFRMYCYTQFSCGSATAIACSHPLCIVGDVLLQFHFITLYRMVIVRHRYIYYIYLFEQHFCATRETFPEKEKNKK